MIQVLKRNLFWVLKKTDKSYRRFLISSMLISGAGYSAYGQRISGLILDEANNPVPFANIFMAGAGFMWIKENHYRHEALYGGIERNFTEGN